MGKFVYWKDYIYENGTLKNKLNIKDSKFLAWKEEEITKLSLLRNVTKLRKLDPFDPNSIKTIHKIIFQDIYEWGGQIRNFDMSKGNFMFAPAYFLKKGTKGSFKKFLNSLKKLVNIFELYADINFAHHFREGNGRTARIWLNLALEKLYKQHVDFSKKDREEYISTMIESHSEGGEVIFNLFKNDLVNVDNNNYEKLFIKNLDASYYYEYLEKYNSRKLLQKLKNRDKNKQLEKHLKQDYDNEK